MGRASIKTNLGDSHMSQSCKNPSPVDIRLERRWKRRDAMAATATKTTAKASENKAVLTDINYHMLEDEVDKDYAEFLDKNVPHIDIDNDEMEEDRDADDETDEDYRAFLDTYDGNTDEADEDHRAFLNTYDGDLDETDEHFRAYLDTYDGDSDEIDEDYRTFLDTCDGDTDETDEDYREFLATYDGYTDETDGDYRAFLATDYTDNEETDEDYSAFLDKYDGDTDETDEDYRAFLETYDSDTNETDEDYRAFLDTYDPDEDYRAFPDTHDTDIDETDDDYRVFLNGDLVEDESSSSDSDLVLLEPNPICENTPFIYSKTYDSSWFDKEMNGRDGKHLSSDDCSQFRRRLMEYLQRPYDQQEYFLSLQEVNQQRQKERHIEIRKRLIKSYHTTGLNKSYLELYPDLAKAIAEFNEPRRVLFLLRGFIFWLKNVCHEGRFQPWLDKSCLEALRKM